MGILRDLFGPSRDELWAQLASQMGARFEEGGLFGRSAVRASHGGWVVTLDTYAVRAGNHTHRYTRIRAPYVNADGFRFEVSRAGLFTELAKWFGMQDVEIGDPLFDEAFVVQGNDPARLRTLLGNDRLRALLARQPHVRFSVVDDDGWFGEHFPDGVDELRFVEHGVITDIARLRALFELFTVTLDELCRMGSAYEDPPGITR